MKTYQEISVRHDTLADIFRAEMAHWKQKNQPFYRPVIARLRDLIIFHDVIAYECDRKAFDHYLAGNGGIDAKLAPLPLDCELEF